MFKKQKCFDKTNVIYNFLIALKDNKCRRELIVVEFHRFSNFDLTVTLLYDLNLTYTNFISSCGWTEQESYQGLVSPTRQNSFGRWSS